MPRVALTDLTIRALKSETRTDFWDSKLPCFGVRVGAHTKTFIVKVGNSRKSVGVYPETSLADARRRAMALKAEKPREGAPTTFGQAYEAFKAHHVANKKERTQRDYKRMIDLYYEPTFKARTLESITFRQISAILDDLADRPAEKWHAISVGQTFFKFCVRRRYIPANPMEGMQIVKNKPRDRVLSDVELQCIWKATEEPTTFNRIVRLLICTGQRKGQIAALRREWIKDDLIEFPASIMKGGKSHMLPLSSMAIALIGQCLENGCTNTSDQLLFPARGSRDTPFLGWSKCKAALDKKLGDSVAPWTLHDARRSAATIWARLRIDRDVREMMLAHAIPGVAQIYDRYDRMAEMKEAMQLYEQHLLSLLAKD